MGSKYEVLCIRYPFSGAYDAEYSPRTMLGLLLCIVRSCMRYEIVDVCIRDHRRMNRTSVE